MTSEVCAANGSSSAVAQSGTSIMSESLIAFQPAIDEPSNITPSLRKSSLIVRTWCARCCHLPRGSVNRKSTYLTSCSLIISMTFWVSDITRFRFLIQNHYSGRGTPFSVSRRHENIMLVAWQDESGTRGGFARVPPVFVSPLHVVIEEELI